MPLTRSNLVVAALVVGGLATGVGTASASSPSPRAAEVAAEQAQELQLHAAIAGLAATEEHLQSTLRHRTSHGADPHLAPGDRPPSRACSRPGRTDRRPVDRPRWCPADHDRRR